MTYKPGQSGNPAGKPKGAISKFNASIKDMVEGALRKVGGVDYLARQAEQNPVAFMGLVGRVLPLQLAGHDGEKLQVEFSWRQDDTPDAKPYRAVASVGSPGQAEPNTTIDGDAVDVEQDDTPQITFIGEC